MRLICGLHANVRSATRQQATVKSVTKKNYFGERFFMSFSIFILYMIGSDEKEIVMFCNKKQKAVDTQ